MKFEKRTYWLDIVCDCGWERSMLHWVNGENISVNCFTRGRVPIKGILRVGVCENPCCEWSVAK